MWGIAAVAIAFIVAAFHEHVTKWILDHIVKDGGPGPRPGQGEQPNVLQAPAGPGAPQPPQGNGPQAPADMPQPQRGPRRERH
jgi:hypothetical protein